MAKTASDRKWEAEDDFRTLTQAEEVRTSPGRLGRAKSAGRRLVRKEQRTLRVKRSIAGSR